MEPEPLPKIIIPAVFFFLALATRGTFAFLETSITALRLFKLKELARSTKKYEFLFQTLENNPHSVLNTTLIASNLSEVTTAALSAHITETIFSYFNLSSGLGFSIGIALGSMAIIVFGEIIPKNLARARGERTLGSMLWLVNGTFIILSPIAALLTRFSDFILNKTHDKQKTENQDEWATSEKEIRFLIDYIHDKGLMESEKTKMISNIFELGSTPVKEIMVPATDIISIDVKASMQDALKVFTKHHFTRLPVYQDSPDNIIGMAHQKDIFFMLSGHIEKELNAIIRPILFIPESVKINQLLGEFKQKHMHIAIVLNEHGSITGLITLEDVLEEIVGDISDEHELETEKITPLPEGGWLVDASIPLQELEDFLKISFTTQYSTTLAGFLTEHLQHLPKKGEKILYQNYHFQVHTASAKRVRQILVSKNQNEVEHEPNKP